MKTFSETQCLCETDRQTDRQQERCEAVFLEAGSVILIHTHTHSARRGMKLLLDVRNRPD